VPGSTDVAAVAAVRTRVGTHTGELMGIPASGNKMEMRSIDIWRVEDGMFVEH
jgi:predicted ester cyclase